MKCVICGEHHEETRGLSFDGCGINDCSAGRHRIFTASRADWGTVAKTVGPACAAGPQLERALREVARVLTPTDPGKFSAEDERRRIGVAHVLIAQALAAVL